MRRDPDNGDRERDDQDEEKKTALAALLAERARATILPGKIALAFVVQRDRDIEPASAGTGAFE